MKRFFKIPQKLAVLFSLTLCLNSCAYAGMGTIFINSAAGTLGYCLNPLSWIIGAMGCGAGIIFSFPMRKYINIELPIGFGIGIGAGIATAYVENYYQGQVNWVGFLAQTGDDGIHGLLGSIIFLLLHKWYRRNKFINQQTLEMSNTKYLNYKFIVFVFIFVIFVGRVSRALLHVGM